jgi:hypothetical protein
VNKFLNIKFVGEVEKFVGEVEKYPVLYNYKPAGYYE